MIFSVPTVEYCQKKGQGETPKDIFCYIQVQNAYPFRQGAHIEGYLSKNVLSGFWIAYAVILCTLFIYSGEAHKCVLASFFPFFLVQQSLVVVFDGDDGD